MEHHLVETPKILIPLAFTYIYIYYQDSLNQIQGIYPEWPHIGILWLPHMLKVAGSIPG